MGVETKISGTRVTMKIIILSLLITLVGSQSTRQEPPSSPPACPGRRRSLRLTTDPTAVPLTGHGPTPLTAETRPGATGTRSCLLPLLPSLKSPPCVSSFYNSHPVALIHYLVGFS